LGRFLPCGAFEFNGILIATALQHQPKAMLHCGVEMRELLR
jgi:hypothetical protein